MAGTSWKYSFHSSGKSVSGHCSLVPRLGFRVAPSAGPHLRQSLFSCSRPVFFKNHQLSKSYHLVRTSLVPRTSPAPVFDRLQYAKTSGSVFIEIQVHMLCGVGFSFLHQALRTGLSSPFGLTSPSPGAGLW